LRKILTDVAKRECSSYFDDAAITRETEHDAAEVKASDAIAERTGDSVGNPEGFMKKVLDSQEEDLATYVQWRKNEETAVTTLPEDGTSRIWTEYRADTLRLNGIY
jgi:hypothetical protein